MASGSHRRRFGRAPGAVIVAGVAVAAAGLAFAASCKAPLESNTRGATGSSSDAGTGGSGDGRPDPAVYAEAVCAYYAKCNPGQEIFYGTGATCRDVLGAYFGKVFAAPGFVATKAMLEACTTKLGSAESCSETTGTLLECQWAGTLSQGEACQFRSQCETTTCADSPTDAGPASCGRCAVEATSGTCQTGSECAFGHACVGGRCTTPRRATEECSTTADCAYGLRCAGGRCSAQLPEGQACTDGNDCDSSKRLVCTSLDASPKKCTPWRLAKLGESCEIENGVVVYCERSACENGKCEPLTAEGQSLPDGGRCLAPLSVRSGVCVSPDGKTCP